MRGFARYCLSRSNENIDACVHNTVNIINAAAGADWGDMFELSAKNVPSQEAQTLVYYLQFAGKPISSSHFEYSESPISRGDCVVSRLKLSIKKIHEAKHIVKMDNGGTVICVRGCG